LLSRTGKSPVPIAGIGLGQITDFLFKLMTATLGGVEYA
jgi:hypothetical protein